MSEELETTVATQIIRPLAIDRLRLASRQILET